MRTAFRDEQPRDGGGATTTRLRSWDAWSASACNERRGPRSRAASFYGAGEIPAYSSSLGGGTLLDASLYPSRARVLSGSSCSAFLKLSAAIEF